MLMSIGHSTHTAEKFVHLLKNGEVEVLVDVRSHPTSRWEQHRKEAYEEYLPKSRIAYLWMPELGGWTAKHMDRAKHFAALGVNIASYSGGKFPKHHIAIDKPDAQTPTWTNQGLFDYSWFTTLPEFQKGLNDLIELSVRVNVAMCCAEGMWWKCHRSMIADNVVFRGGDVRHLPGRKTHGQTLGDRLTRYDPRIIDIWRQHAV